MIIKRLVRDLAFETEIVVLPTVREESGLALSSRNAFLTEEEKRAATVIYRALSRAKEAYKAGERSGSRLLETVRGVVASEPLARLDYVSATDAETLENLEKLDDRTVLVALAVYLGKTRLIDNIILNRKKNGSSTAAL
jgi:pantoate--beta-alanine ligase